MTSAQGFYPAPPVSEEGVSPEMLEEQRMPEEPTTELSQLWEEPELNPAPSAHTAAFDVAAPGRDRLMQTTEDRLRENELVFEGHESGMSYGEMRRLYGIKRTAATLRGVVRMKKREACDRVRRPTWQRRDVSLSCSPQRSSKVLILTIFTDPASCSSSPAAAGGAEAGVDEGQAWCGAKWCQQ